MVTDMDIDVVAEPAAAHWQDILQLAFHHLDLASIWCLSLTSKAAEEFCLERLSDGKYEHARELLFRAVAAEAANQQLTRQHDPLVAAVEWVLNAEVIPEHLLSLDSTRYLCISDSSFRQDLLYAGVDVTYEGVVTAARKLTRGLYEWIEDCEECDIELEINEITRSACCSDEMPLDTSFLSSGKIILDHLYMAVNCIGGLNPVVDGNACSNIIGLCSLLAADEISAEAVGPFLHAVVQVFGTRGCTTLDHCEIGAVDAVCHLPAAQKLSATAVFSLLKAAIETRPTHEVLPVFSLPAVSYLNPPQKVELIQMYLRAVLTAEQAKDIDNFPMFARVLDLLETARLPEDSRKTLFKSLVGLAAEDIADVTRISLMTVGLMSAPGMKVFTPVALVDLLRFVLESGRMDPRLPGITVDFFMDVLCSCPTAAELSAECVDQLLQQARALPDSASRVKALLQLPGFRQLASK